jgi:hypothetical protein
MVSASNLVRLASFGLGHAIVPEREAKRQKTATDNTGSVDLIPATAEEEEVVVRASYDGGWWASGNARQLFAPCNTVYDKECNVKEIVMECIKMLEAVNCLPSNWKTVIDTRSTSSTVHSGAKLIPILKLLALVPKHVSCSGTEAICSQRK